MDLVGWDETVFDAIAVDFAETANRLALGEFVAIPMSALKGDNVVDPSASMPWYDGPTLLEYLETLEVASSHDLENLRFPVQYVILAAGEGGGHHDERRYAGQIAGGVLRPGTDVIVQPGGQRTRITAVHAHDGWLQEAFPPQSVTVSLADDVDVGRGDMLVAADPAATPPLVAQELDATVCWMSERPLAVGGRYSLKHTTRSARAVVTAVIDRLDVDTLDRLPADGLALNEIGRVTLRTTVPVVADPYARNRVTGRFILIDEATNGTAAAGMIV
jgi:bifunctional enzyme CysN/CysC